MKAPMIFSWISTGREKQRVPRQPLDSCTQGQVVTLKLCADMSDRVMGTVANMRMDKPSSGGRDLHFKDSAHQTHLAQGITIIKR